jgi:hypothetical protein
MQYLHGAHRSRTRLNPTGFSTDTDRRPFLAFSLCTAWRMGKFVEMCQTQDMARSSRMRRSAAGTGIWIGDERAYDFH